jgi:hypothetical protein
MAEMFRGPNLNDSGDGKCKSLTTRHDGLKIGCNTNECDAGTKYGHGAVAYLKFPYVAKCCKNSGTGGCLDKWKGGIKLCADIPYVSSLPENATASQGSECWSWACNEGFKLSDDKKSCIIDLSNCTAANNKYISNGACVDCGSKVVSGNSCKNKLNPGQGYASDTDDTPVDCPTLKYDNTIHVYQMTIQDICVKCPYGTHWVKGGTASTYLPGYGNCGEFKKVRMDKLKDCAKDIAQAEKFSACINGGANLLEGREFKLDVQLDQEMKDALRAKFGF